MTVWFFIFLQYLVFCIKFQWASMNVSKVITWRKLKKSLLDLKISTFLKFWPCYLEKLNFFPSKNHLAFLTIERYDIEMTNIKISDKNIVHLGGVQVPEGGSFLVLFWNVADFGMNTESAKNFHVQNFIVHGN